MQQSWQYKLICNSFFKLTKYGHLETSKAWINSFKKSSTKFELRFKSKFLLKSLLLNALLSAG